MEASCVLTSPPGDSDTGLLWEPLPDIQPHTIDLTRTAYYDSLSCRYQKSNYKFSFGIKGKILQFVRLWIMGHLIGAKDRSGPTGPGLLGLERRRAMPHPPSCSLASAHTCSIPHHQPTCCSFLSVAAWFYPVLQKKMATSPTLLPTNIFLALQLLTSGARLFLPKFQIKKSKGRIPRARSVHQRKAPGILAGQTNNCCCLLRKLVNFTLRKGSLERPVTLPKSFKSMKIEPPKCNCLR